ncbi:MAG TPA: hypothetical protein VMV56_06530 [Williamwhitmania sp.]|nr:hypothetical protein [Williamwhitmania sp.]
MPYLIHDIKNVAPEDHPLYFFDANVWIAALKYYSGGKQNEYESPYQSFFEVVVELNETHDPEILKRLKNKPKIVLTSLVLSEIINAYMRKVAMRNYFGNGDEYRRYDFKRDYRDKTDSDYKAKLKDLCTDIDSLSDYAVLMDDDFKAIYSASTLGNLYNYDLDFNDFYYGEFLKKYKLPLVTHDKDCKFENVVTITAQERLLKISDI